MELDGAGGVMQNGQLFVSVGDLLVSLLEQILELPLSVTLHFRHKVSPDFLKKIPCLEIPVIIFEMLHQCCTK